MKSIVSLPDAVVSKIFKVLSLMYGAKFSELWNGQDPAELKAFWARELGGFSDRLEIIASALESCREKDWPPTLPEFLKLCRDSARRAGTHIAALEAPRMDREEAKKRLAEIRSSVLKRAA